MRVGVCRIPDCDIPEYILNTSVISIELRPSPDGVQTLFLRYRVAQSGNLLLMASLPCLFVGGLTQKVLVGGVVGFFFKAVLHRFKCLFEFFALATGHLQTNQYLAISRAVIAIVEHGDIPSFSELA